MSGECDECSEHTLECKCNQKENMPVDVTVIVKNEDTKLTREFSLDSIVLERNAPSLIGLIKGVVDEFGKPVDDVIVKTTMVWV